MRFTRIILLAAVVAFAVPTIAPAQSYFRVVSWNARHMGWSGETDWTGYANQVWRQYGTSSTSTNGCDVIFIQELMDDTSASSFRSALQTASGVTWDFRITGTIGRSSYKERYGVFFRTDRVSLVSHYVWNDTTDRFEREPHIVKLRDRATNADFTFINWHTIWGTTSQRVQEINDIADVFRSVQNSDSSDQDVILLGDHNRSATDSAWNRLRSTSLISPQVSYRVNDLTTINNSCAFANAYDHFWFQSSFVTEFSNAGRDYIANMCTFYNLSDHAPIWLRLYSTSDSD